MQYYSSYALFFFLLQQCLAQDQSDQMMDTTNAVDELLNKINDLSVQSFLKAPYNAKLELLRKVEAKLKKASKSLGKKGEKYVKLIMKGIKSKALNETADDVKTQVKISTNIDNISDIKEKINVMDDIPIIKTSTKSHGENNISTDLNQRSEIHNLNHRNENDSEDPNQDFVLKEHLRRNNIVFNEMNDNHSRDNNVSLETSTERLIQSLTPRYECEGNIEKICLDIKQMRQLKCHFDDSVVPIDKLCDGITDCIDRTDEKFCTSQGLITERLQNANRVIYETDEAFQLGCFPNTTKGSVMSTQIIVLRSILHAQQEFVQKYKYFNRSLIPNNEYLKGEGTVKVAVNEISLIISTLALTLDTELCSQQIKTGDDFLARKFNDLLIEDFDKVMEEVEWSPKSCICKGDRCENNTCTKHCSRICWQKHCLTRWGCPSTNETENVPLSVICDGKFDCYDQSDEKDCATGISYAKYEAHKHFQQILASLSVKITSREYAYIRNILVSLHNTIEELQKCCMASEPDLKTIRALRNKCFSALSSIYSETLSKSSFLYLKSEVYLFLMSLNEKIVNALKRSHTGNKRIISNDGCYCRNGRCSMPLCSRSCHRSCIAEPWLTRYFCENSSNKSVSLDEICNGKPNCPKEDDETHCEKEICRRHHLTLLRNNIQKIGKKQEGTSMGELLTKWKIKVSSTLLIAENDYRPNPNTIRDIIRDILSDLVTTYGAVKDYRRDNEYALQEFTDIARNIMTFIKSCSY